MRIIRTSLTEGLEHNPKNKEFIREITSRILSVCENSTSFKDKKERLLRISDKHKKLQEKSSKLGGILEKASKVKRDLFEKEEKLDSYNSNLKERLLKMLGSEL